MAAHGRRSVNASLNLRFPSRSLGVGGPIFVRIRGCVHPTRPGCPHRSPNRSHGRGCAGQPADGVDAHRAHAIHSDAREGRAGLDDPRGAYGGHRDAQGSLREIEDLRCRPEGEGRITAPEYSKRGDRTGVPARGGSGAPSIPRVSEGCQRERSGRARLAGQLLDTER
jgi:hypothetical protein